jgi:roadblock/LC7 domain-containing protein
MAAVITNLLSGGLADGIAKIIGLFKIDPNVAAQHAEDLAKIQADMQQKILDGVQQMSVAQNQVNTAEAQNKNIFIAGWRPFIGWVCGSGLATQFIIGPFVTWAATLLKHPVAFPTLDMGTLLTLLLGMLGLGGMRTYEKVAGITDPNLKD